MSLSFSFSRKCSNIPQNFLSNSFYGLNSHLYTWESNFISSLNWIPHPHTFKQTCYKLNQPKIIFPTSLLSELHVHSSISWLETRNQLPCHPSSSAITRKSSKPSSFTSWMFLCVSTSSLPFYHCFPAWCLPQICLTAEVNYLKQTGCHDLCASRKPC